jgi:hypothetical protein
MASSLLLEGRPLAVALGRIPGVRPVRLSGYGSMVAGTYKVIAPTGIAYPWLATAQTLEVVSSSPVDDVGDIGAQAVRLTGLAADLSEQTEDVALDGTTPVPTTKTWWRINDVEVLGATTNLGTVKVRRIAPNNADLLALISGRDGRMMSSHRSVPAGRRLLVSGYSYSSRISRVFLRRRWRNLGGPWRLDNIWMLTTPAFPTKVGADVFQNVPEVFPAGADVVWEGNMNGDLSFDLAAVEQEV